MNFEQFPKNPIETKSKESFEDKIKKISSLENSVFDRFRSGKIGKVAVLLSFMTAMAASFEKSYAQDFSTKESQKEEDFFDLSGSAKGIDGKQFILNSEDMQKNIKTTPSEKIVFEEVKFENIGNQDGFIKEDENGNVQSRSIGEIK